MLVLSFFFCNYTVRVSANTVEFIRFNVKKEDDFKSSVNYTLYHHHVYHHRLKQPCA